MWHVCPIQEIISVISKKWVLNILKALSDGADSFSTIKKQIPKINSRILTERLTEMETYKLVERKIVSERPVKIKYFPTSRCLELEKEFKRIEELVRKWWLE